MIETELKFEVKSARSARALLKRAGAKPLEKRARIKDLVFDSKGNLEKSGRLLRLRDYGGRAFVTFKGKKRKLKGFKSREELEFRVSDAREARKVFESLGFKAKHGLSKYRASWTLLGCRVELDELSFGTYLELEGSKQAIRRAAAELGLDLKDGLPVSYFKLAKCSRSS